MEHYSYTALMYVLREQMKQRKLKFNQLALMLKVPESTLKKWFSGQDGPFSRINQICDIFGITLGDLVEMVHKQGVHTFVFSEEQQKYFEGDPMAFYFFWLIVYERLDQQKAEEFLRLSKSQSRKILLRLDRLALVELDAGDRLRVPRTIPIRWAYQGKFIERIYKYWSMGILSSALEKESGSSIILQHFQLSARSVAELEEDLLKLEEKYASRTILEMNVGTEKLNQVRFLLSTALGGFLQASNRVQKF